MSNPKQAGSPSQPSSSGKDAHKIKKSRQRRERGIKSARKNQLTPISKYLIKEESQQLETRSSPPDSAPETTSQPPSSVTTLASTAQRVEELPESSSRSTASAESPRKTVREVKQQQQEEEKEEGKRKDKKRDNNRDIGNKGKTKKSGGGGGVKKTSESGERGRRVVARRQDNTVPVKREIQPSIRDHFPVRRSGRRSKSELEREAFERTAQRLRNKDESGLKVIDIEGKGRGVVSTRVFSRNELVCEYSGELISHEAAKRREEEYEKDSSIGCYMYYFTHKNNKLCVDATIDNGRKGRLLNHSKTSANVVTKLMEVDNQPYLCLVAARDLSIGEELEYDYGERAKVALDSHPWLTT